MNKAALSLEFHELNIEGYERVVEIREREVGLHAIVAIHDTTLGPALGGTRAYAYKSFDDALEDVLRLSEGMTYKAAIAESGTGGGKSVLIMDSHKPKSPALLEAFAEAVNYFEGTYICAEDIGMSVADLAMINKNTKYAVGLPTSSGNPARFTAWGGFRGVQATCYKLFGSPSVSGRTFAIQGLGAVGMEIAGHLFWGGARLIVTDINQAVVDKAVRDFGAIAVSPEAIFGVECDVLVPCAMGGILNCETIPLLRCKAVAGLANNQLLTAEDGDALYKREILYAPDYVINAGGLLNVAVEIRNEGYNAIVARQSVDRIYDLIVSIFTLSAEKKVSTHRIANGIASDNIKKKIGKREQKVVFHT
ncbi:MAG: Glu/Leu/Phe/Val dehydrogenase dimerization domain-containing protein [Chlamydiales bacterium]